MLEEQVMRWENVKWTIYDRFGQLGRASMEAKTSWYEIVALIFIILIILNGCLTTSNLQGNSSANHSLPSGEKHQTFLAQLVYTVFRTAECIQKDESRYLPFFSRLTGRYIYLSSRTCTLKL